MTAPDANFRELTLTWRRHGWPLLWASEAPHDEVLTLLWGPRFDRDHALALWAGCPGRTSADATPLLPALMAAAERFDRLPRSAQHRLRRLVIRHRRLACQGAVQGENRA